MARYRLPESLGGREYDATNDEPGYTKVGFDLNGVTDRLWLKRTDLTEVKPPLPEEPPYLAVVVDQDGQAWQRFMERPAGKPEWFCAGDGADEAWEGLQRFGPLTRLVPDPFAEPVELPWKRQGVHVQQTHDSGKPSNMVYVSTKDASYSFAHVKPVVAREMARALWAAADAADKEQS